MPLEPVWVDQLTTRRIVANGRVDVKKVVNREAMGEIQLVTRMPDSSLVTVLLSLHRYWIAVNFENGAAVIPD